MPDIRFIDLSLNSTNILTTWILHLYIVGKCSLHQSVVIKCNLMKHPCINFLKIIKSHLNSFPANFNNFDPKRDKQKTILYVLLIRNKWTKKLRFKSVKNNFNFLKCMNANRRGQSL